MNRPFSDGQCLGKGAVLCALWWPDPCGGLTRAGGLAARAGWPCGGLTSPDGLAAQTVGLALLDRPHGWRQPAAVRMQKAGTPCGTPALFFLLAALLTRAWRAA